MGKGVNKTESFVSANHNIAKKGEKTVEEQKMVRWLDDCYWGSVIERLCKKYGLKAIQTKKGVEVE